MAQWLEREFTDWKVLCSNPISASRLPLSRFGQPDSISALGLLSGGMAVTHRTGDAAERFFWVQSDAKPAPPVKPIEANVLNSHLKTPCLWPDEESSSKSETPKVRCCNDLYTCYLLWVSRQPLSVAKDVVAGVMQLFKNRSAVSPFQCLTAIPPEGSTRAGILSSCPVLGSGNREAVVGFEPQTFRLITGRIWRDPLPKNHRSQLLSLYNFVFAFQMIAIGTTASSFAFHFLVDYLASCFPPSCISSTTRQRQCSESKGLFIWRNSVLSCVHASVTGIGALFAFYLHPDMSKDLIFAQSSFSISLVAYSLGYFIADSVHMCWWSLERSTFELLVHHFAVSLHWLLIIRVGDDLFQLSSGIRDLYRVAIDEAFDFNWATSEDECRLCLSFTTDNDTLRYFSPVLIPRYLHCVPLSGPMLDDALAGVEPRSNQLTLLLSWNYVFGTDHVHEHRSIHAPRPVGRTEQGFSSWSSYFGCFNSRDYQFFQCFQTEDCPSVS
ncbi:TLC domain-containing protein 2 [Clonorchis sinensis]|uniref:TLC domain-containing protein 2 n=1 Tax=Clonorchis sinensis TaxID=79923 RepID=G7YQ87_CLOSI|nr:TLC domain-containing protein 2 [Clonorchis sinensis]